MLTSTRKNILYLLGIQGGNYLFPLLLLPYLGRVLGVEEFGVLSYCLAVGQYLILLTDFGFNLSATRRVALCHDDRNALNSVYSATTTVRLGLALVSLLVLWGCVVFIPAFGRHAAVMFAAFIAVIGNAFFPIWLFQGLEQMRLLMVASFVARLLSFLLVILFVRTSSDTVMAAACMGASNVILAAIAFLVICKKKLVAFSWPGRLALIDALKDSFPIFGANMATSFYITFSPILLGWLTTNVIVGQFSTADKIRLAAQSLMLPVAQALYPGISQAYQTDFPRARALFKKARLLLVATAVGCFVLIQLLGPTAINVLFGPGYAEVIPLLRLEALLLPIISISLVYGQLGLIAAGDSHRLAKIYCVAGLLHIIFVVPLTMSYSAAGTIVAIIITESLASAAIFWRYRRTCGPLAVQVAGSKTELSMPAPSMRISEK